MASTNKTKSKGARRSSHRRSSSSSSSKKSDGTPRSSDRKVSTRSANGKSSTSSNNRHLPRQSSTHGSPATSKAAAAATTEATPTAEVKVQSPALLNDGPRRSSAPPGTMAAATAASNGPAANAPQLPPNGMSTYGSMGNAGYGFNSMGPGMSGYGSMAPGMGGYGMMGGPNGGYGSMAGAGMQHGMGSAYGSMGGGAGAASQRGMENGYGSMAGGGPNGGYGSMLGANAPNEMGSAYGTGMSGGYGSMAGAGSQVGGYGSMGGTQESGLSAAGGYGSMYGAENGETAGDNTNTNMYGGPGGGYGSMYGGGPMGGGSMYGMNPMMMGGGGSFYGMGMGSMYGGMGGGGSIYGLGRYNSMGLGSNYASMYGLGRVSSRSSFRSSGGYVGGSFAGLWRAPSGISYLPKKDYSLPPPSNLLSEAPHPTAKASSKTAAASEAEKKDRTSASPSSTRAVPPPASVPPTATTESPADKTKATEKPALEKEASEKAVGEKGAAEKRDPAHTVTVVESGLKEEKPSKSRAMALAAASSHRLTKQVNDMVHAIAIVNGASQLNMADKSITVDGVPYKMDEILVSPVDVNKSDLLTDVVEQTQCGHNVSLVALCGSQPYGDVLPTVTPVIEGMMDAFDAAPPQITQVMLSALLFTAPDEAIDLVADTTDVTFKPELGSHPIYGPCALNVSEKPVRNAAEAVAAMTEAARAAEKRGLLVVTYKIKQIRPTAGSSGTRNVYVSSMLVALVDDANVVHVKAAEKHSIAGAAPLFGNAIGGASRTVVLVQVPEKDTDTLIKNAAATAQELREIKNTPTRSGNVKRFVDYTERAAAANTKASPETATKIQRMLKDAKDLLANPEEATLCGYGTVVPASSAEAKSDSEAEARSRAVPEPEKAEEKATEEKPAEEKPSEETPAEEKTGVSAAAAAAKAEPEKKPEADKQVRLTVCVDGTAPITLEHGEEVVTRATPEELPDSVLLRTLRSNFCHGRNIALVSAETQPSIALPQQYTWKCVSGILHRVLAEPAQGIESTKVELFMVVVRKRQMLCDLMEPSGAAKPLAIASSPLFGPIVAETQHKVLTKPEEVQPALEEALGAAGPHIAEADAMIVMTAVLTQVQPENKDVLVASFMCVSGPSGEGVSGAMSKNPEYSRSLFAYTVGGPCVTALLLSVGDEHLGPAVARGSYDALYPLTKQPNHASRDGSVCAFLEYADKALSTNEAKIAKAPEDEKARLRGGAGRLRTMSDDYKALLDDPVENSPAYYLGDRRVGVKSSEAEKKEGEERDGTPLNVPAPIRTVLVVLKGKAGGEEEEGTDTTKLEVAAKDVAISGSEHRYAPTELISSEGGVLHSIQIDDLPRRALKGYNAAMLTSDAPGSTVGMSMAVKALTVSLKELPEKSEAFWSVVVSKEKKVKDMLMPNSPYYDLHLASSPLFGNVAYGATIAPVTLSQLEPMVREVRGEVRENGGVGYITLILRITKSDGDVCMPSFLVTIAGDSVAEYEHAMAARSSGTLLSTSIGGPCSTVYVAGVRAVDGEAAKPMLELGQKAAKVMNAPLRSGSIRRFIAHTEPTLVMMKKKLEASGSEPNPALMAQVGRIATMLKDAQSMLTSPGGSAPAVYKR